MHEVSWNCRNYYRALVVTLTLPFHLRLSCPQNEEILNFRFEKSRNELDIEQH